MHDQGRMGGLPDVVLSLIGLGKFRALVRPAFLYPEGKEGACPLKSTL